jgi:alpha-1,2-mannosyltransferase
MLKISPDLCNYLVDSDYPLRYDGNGTFGNLLEPRYTIMSDTWSRVDCKPFLDASNSGLFGRSFWLPIGALDASFWGEFCLLKRSH